MGFYVRKSVRVGPLRFNLSRSGIGVSTGIPGLRVGVGPRGTYVHMGRGGFYYRQTLSSPAGRDSHSDPPISEVATAPAHTHGPMEAIGSECVTKMVDINSASLLAEIERKRRLIVWWPFLLTAAFALVAVLIGAHVSLWLTVPCILLLAVATLLVYQYDQFRKCVVLMYDLDGPNLESYASLFAAIGELSRCHRVWHITAQGQVYDRKYHAGADNLIRRNRWSVSYRNPPYVRTNLSVPCLPFGQHTMYLLPDRILVYAPKGLGAVDYSVLSLSSGPTRFIEGETVPRDAKVVDRTWRYVNKNGGPDRRFNNNHEIPICEYEELQITSSTGVNEVLQLSRLGASAHLEAAIESVVEGIRAAQAAEKSRQEEKRRAREVREMRSTAPVLNPPVVEQKSSQQTLNAAMFDILCCIMVADGRASSSEKASIMNVMNQLNSGWSRDECQQRIAVFLQDVKAHGYRAVRQRAMARIPLFQRAGDVDQLLKCVGLIASADGNLTESEIDLCNQIRELARGTHESK